MSAQDLQTILDKFTDSATKRKKCSKKAESERKRRRIMMMDDKVMAKDVFNDPIDLDVYNEWSKHLNCMLTIEELKKFDTRSKFPTEKQCEEDGILSIFTYFKNEIEGRKWLNAKLAELGWTSNQTKYDPIHVSHCTQELKDSIQECLKMAIKQLRLMHAYLSLSSSSNANGN